MSTGYPPPPGSPVPPPASYQPIPGPPGFAAPVYALPQLSDQALRQLPPPAPVAGSGTAVLLAPPQRPAVVAIAATLAVTASLQWLCVLSLAWVTAAFGGAELDQQGAEGAFFHILNRFNYRMLDGLAWPLYGFPLASVVTGFALLSGRGWSRIAHTATGLLALGWSAWWLRDNLVWWASPAVYVVIACLILWTPAASRWYASPARAG